MTEMKTTAYYFLLGGYDLEMVEIRKLLEANGYKEGEGFADHHLNWEGAKLSSYQAELEAASGRRVVGIELREDIPVPDGYVKVDHHNELAHLRAAIVQVAELLGVELDRWQQLVAANDARYIPGMLEIGATQSEVERVRLEDRRAQGVTEEDERLGEEAVGSRVVEGLVTVVRSKTGRFSTVTDRLYGVRRLLVYSDEELCYYGEMKAMLVERCAELIQSGVLYHGGGDLGYLGSAKGRLSIGQIQQLRDQIISLTWGGGQGNG